MDRRKRTGVALAAGLLFLFVTEILLLFLAGNSLYKEEQGKLGALVLSHPEQETEYIELFDRGKQRNRQEEEAGKELEERYGYTPFDGRSVKTFARGERSRCEMRGRWKRYAPVAGGRGVSFVYRTGNAGGRRESKILCGVENKRKIYISWEIWT